MGHVRCPDYFALLKDMPLPVYPFPDHPSPFEERITEDLNKWLDNDYRFLTEEARNQYKRHDFGFATARSFPYLTSYQYLLPITRYTAWGTIFDDHFEYLSFDEKDNLREQVVSALRSGRIPEGPEANYLIPLIGMRDELLAFELPSWWFDRFVDSLNWFIRGIQDEDCYKTNNRIPPVEHLKLIREYSIGMYPWIELIALEQGCVLPSRILEHPVIRHLKKLVANMVAYQNDFVSLPKELTRGDGEVMNLVLAVQQDRIIGLEEAYMAALDIHNADLNAFLTLQSNLPDFGEHQRDAEVYARYLAQLVKGCADWEGKTAFRYSQGGYVEPPRAEKIENVYSSDPAARPKT
ncbi:terpene synthase family protein [Mycobacterium heidelbergense]|uniref:terpene synthase family protein n=1 Tax=Mycobacterium heidelbergense TaxID=53376 RepID=UPI003CF9018A